MSDVVTTDGITVDTDVPVISSVIEGSLTADIDYQNSDTTLIIDWSGSDAASGIAQYEYALGTASGEANTVTWTSAGLDTFTTLTGINLTEGTTYYASARATDVAENLSAVASGDGITIDLTAPLVGTVIDGTGEDIAFTGSDSTLTAEWTGFSDAVSGIEGYEAAIGTSSGGTEVLDWTSVGEGTSWTKTGLSLEHATMYYLSVRAKDVAGNMSMHTTTNGVLVDTEPPGSVVDISADYYNAEGWDADVQIHGTAFDEHAGLSHMEVSIRNTGSDLQWNGSSWVGSEEWLSASGTDSWTYEHSSANLTDGAAYEVRSRGSDNVGNVETSYGSDTFIYDISEPNCDFTITEEYYSSGGWESAQPIHGTAADDYSPVTTVEVRIVRQSDQYYWSGAEWSADATWLTAEDTAEWNYDLSAEALTDAVQYTVSVRATDAAGNVETTYASDTFIFDSSPPFSSVIIELDYYNNINWDNASSISGTAGDSTSGLASVEIAVHRSSDGAWWGGFTWGGDETWLSPVGTDSWTYSLNSVNLTDGILFTVFSRAADNVANVQSELGEDTFTYDLTPPVAGSVYDGAGEGDDDWTNSTTDLSAHWSGFSDLTSGIVAYHYAIGTTSGGSDVVSWTDVGTDSFADTTGLELTGGITYYVSVKAVDGAGNTSTPVSSDGITVDASAPVISSVFEGSTEEDLDYQYDETSLLVVWTASDDLSKWAGGGKGSQFNPRDIGSYEVSLGTTVGDSSVVPWLNVGSATSYTFTGLSLDQGVPYYASVRAVDMAGNVSEIASGDGITIDQQGPFAGEVSDGDSTDVDWININYQITSNWSGFTDTLSGIAYYELSVGLNPGQTQVVNWTSAGLDSGITVSASLNEGPTYYVNVRAADAVGNMGDEASSDGFGLDVSNPVAGTVIDGTESDIDWTSSTTTLAAAWSGFSDAYSGIEFYEYAIGTTSGGTNVLEWTNNDTSTEVTNVELDLDNGLTYFISVRATDLVDNVSDAATTDGITVDTIPPVINTVFEGAVDQDEDFQGSDTTFTIGWEGSDDASGIAQYEYSVGTTPGDSDVVAWSDAGLVTDAFETSLSLSEGVTYFASVRAYDTAGNISEVLSGDGITVDLTPPELGTVIDGVETDLIFTGSVDTLMATWTGFSDNLSGIEHYEYAVGSLPGDSDIYSWISVGMDTTATAADLTLDHATPYYQSVRAVDLVNNVSLAMTSNGVITDHSAPVSGAVIDGLTEDENWTESSNTLMLSWSGFSDTTSGLQFYEYAFGSSPGGDDIFPWTDAGLDSMTTDSGLILENDVTYYGSVRAIDNVDNVSVASISDGITVDLFEPTVGIPAEGHPEDLDYQGSPDTLAVFWPPSDEPQLDFYEFSVGTTPGDSNTVGWINVGVDTNAVVTGLSLVYNVTYYVSLRAFDLAGNRSMTANSDGITVDLYPPITGVAIDGTIEDEQFTGSTTTLVASWSDFADTVSGIQFYEYAVGTTSGATDVMDWTPAGLNTSVTDQSFTLVDEQTYYISIRATDNVDNVSGEVTTNGITADHTGPEGYWVVDGDSSDIDRQNYIDHFEGYWSLFTDGTSDLNRHEYALYDTTSSEFYLSWTDAGTDTSVVLTGQELTVDHVYQLQVRGVDNVENIGTIVKSDGVLVDRSAPAAPQNLLGFFSSERIRLIWDPSPEEDFAFYTVYAGTEPEPTNAVLQIDSSEAEAFVEGFQDGA
ncbi:MAG: hypothetical protein QGE95_13235, partial [Arenicellales bacterium]|nr:hypothetical protein [Arenicellales bacterium]